VIPVIVTAVELLVVAFVEIPAPFQVSPVASVIATRTPASGEPAPSTIPVLGKVTSELTTT
jgi:hypothetical protein